MTIAQQMNTVKDKIETGPLPSDPAMTELQSKQLKIAHAHIANKSYLEAYEHLKLIAHPRAKRWMQLLEQKHASEIKPVKAKRNLWPIILILFVIMIIALIVINRQMGSLSFLPTSNQQSTSDTKLLISIETNRQSLDNDITCHKHPAGPNDSLDPCALLKVKFLNCADGLTTWEKYNQCVADFKQGVSKLEN